MDAPVKSASERLHAAYLGAQAGRHEQALREYLWFHDHALEEDRHQSAVRLSFALSHWKELADVYPPALAALEAVRDRDTAALLAQPGNWHLFHDIVSINERLGCEERTAALFADLARRDPAFAGRCIEIALPSLIKTGDFALAERFLPDPEDTVRLRGDMLNRLFRRRRSRKFWPAPRIEWEIDNYVRAVKQVLCVLDACGRRSEAAALRRLAADLIPATTIRRAVRAALLPNARPLDERGLPRKRRR